MCSRGRSRAPASLIYVAARGFGMNPYEVKEKLEAQRENFVVDSGEKYAALFKFCNAVHTGLICPNNDDLGCRVSAIVFTSL